MRIIIFTGKGGVGKTSMAAATACSIAESGKKVLVMSTDQAHSLGDSFDMKLGKEPVNVMENLDAMEIDTVYESGEYDTLIVDCAPTGETLSLLKYPEMLSELIEKVLPVKRKGIKTVGPIVEKVARVPMPEDKVFVAESGITGDEDVRFLRDCGVDAFLIGRAFMESENPKALAQKWKELYQA